MKKVKHKKMCKGIRTTQLKFNCKFNNDEVFEEVSIRVKYRSQTRKHLAKRSWLKLLKPSFLFKRITEIIKALF